MFLIKILLCDNPHKELFFKAYIAGQHNFCKVYLACWLTLGIMYTIDMNIVHIYHKEHEMNYAIMQVYYPKHVWQSKKLRPILYRNLL